MRNEIRRKEIENLISGYALLHKKLCAKFAYSVFLSARIT